MFKWDYPDYNVNFAALTIMLSFFLCEVADEGGRPNLRTSVVGVFQPLKGHSY